MDLKKLKSILSAVMAAAILTASGSFVMTQTVSVHSGTINNYYADSSSKSKVVSKNSSKSTKMYVTGITDTITLRDTNDTDGKVLAKLKLKDEVEAQGNPIDGYYLVYYKAKNVTGYIKKDYLTTDKNAVCKRQNAYTSKKTTLYADKSEKPKTLKTMNKNSAIFIVSKDSGDYWYVYYKSGKTFGYVKSMDISNNKVSSSSSTSSSKTSSSSGKSKSTASNSTSTKNNVSSNYTVWTVGNTGGGEHYLALRTAPAFDYANEIGKLYNGQVVYVYDTSYSSYYDTYWYVYSPSHGKWGYVNSNYIFS